MATDYSYIGSGRVYLRDLSTGSLVEVGNVSALNFAVSEDVKTLKDFTTPGGGTYNEVRRIESVEMSLTMHDLSPENLARAVYGVSSTLASAVQSAANLGAAYKGQFLPFLYMAQSSPVPTVDNADALAAATRVDSTPYALGALIKPATPNTFFYKVTTAGTSAATPPVFPTTIGATVSDGTATITNWGKLLLVSATDYDLRPNGILIRTDAGLTDGSLITTTYTRAASSVVEALVNSGKEYEMYFDGLNEARSSKRFSVRAWRVRLGAAGDLGLIADDYAGLELTGKLLKDTTITGTNISQYFRITQET